MTDGGGRLDEKDENDRGKMEQREKRRGRIML
jgi:hypothetical protein